MAYEVILKGFNTLANGLNNAKTVIDNANKAMMEKATLMVQAEAKVLSPVDTGTLRRSITRKVEQNNGMYIGRVGTNIKYAPYQEYGTKRGVPAKMYLHGALAKMQANKDIIKELGQKILDGIIK